MSKRGIYQAGVVRIRVRARVRLGSGWGLHAVMVALDDKQVRMTMHAQSQLQYCLHWELQVWV